MEEYLASVIPEPTTLLGQELRPLSIGHLIYLERLGCLPADNPERLVTAVIVCSHKFEEILPTLQDPWLNWKIRLWRWRLGEPEWQDKYEIWTDYHTHHTRAPLVTSKNEGSPDSDTPFLQHLKVTLQSQLNYTPTEALNCPFGQAIHDYYTYHEIQGSVSIVDREKSAETQQWLEDNKEQILADAARISEEEQRKANGA